MRNRLLTTIISLAAVAAAAPATAGAANSFGSQIYAISTGGTIQNQDATTLARDLDTMQTAGSRWVRIDINWAQIQSGGPSSYNWGPIDRVVQGATARGMNVLGIIAYTPSWARPSGASSTYGPDPQQYAAFAKAAAQHYSAMGVHAYEVWNEPNIVNFWTPSPSPAAYTRLLKAAYPAIKAGDPQATVLSGGTAPATTNGTNYSPVDFLRGIYNNGGAGFFDAVSHHPYCWPAEPGEAQSWSAWYQMYGTSTSLRSLMVANGDGAKKIWGTEFGAPTDGPSGTYVSESTQAQMIAKAYTLWKGYDWAGPLFTYSSRDHGTSESTRENFYGLVRHDFSQKPSFDAYRTAATGTTTDPDDGGDDGTTETPTDTTVRGNGNGKGKVKGKVSATGVTSRAARVVRTGRVRLGLQRKTESGGWHRVARATKRLTRDGRFHKRVRAFRGRQRPGVYRVQATYLGTRTTKPSSSRSRRFRLRD